MEAQPPIAIELKPTSEVAPSSTHALLESLWSDVLERFLRDTIQYENERRVLLEFVVPRAREGIASRRWIVAPARIELAFPTGEASREPHAALADHWVEFALGACYPDLQALARAHGFALALPAVRGRVARRPPRSFAEARKLSPPWHFGFVQSELCAVFPQRPKKPGNLRSFGAAPLPPFAQWEKSDLKTLARVAQHCNCTLCTCDPPDLKRLALCNRIQQALLRAFAVDVVLQQHAERLHEVDGAVAADTIQRALLPFDPILRSFNEPFARIQTECEEDAVLKGFAAKLSRLSAVVEKVRLAGSKAFSPDAVPEIVPWLTCTAENPRSLVAPVELRLFRNRPFNLLNLERFYFQQPALRGTVNRLSRLPELRALWLGGNQLEALDMDFTLLQGLLYLDLGANSLGSLPDSLARCKNLAYLSLSDNPIAAVPEPVFQLTGLKVLDVSRCPLPGAEVDKVRAALPRCEVVTAPRA